MSGDCEVWNNSYALDGETELLLHRMQSAPLDDDAILRACVNDIEILSLLDETQKTALKNSMVWGAARFTVSAGSSNAFSAAIQKNQQQTEVLRQTLEWGKLSAVIRRKAARRVEIISQYAQQNGWMERVGTHWNITAKGHELLAGGGFSLR